MNLGKGLTESLCHNILTFLCRNLYVKDCADDISWILSWNEETFDFQHLRPGLSPVHYLSKIEPSRISKQITFGDSKSGLAIRCWSRWPRSQLQWTEITGCQCLCCLSFGRTWWHRDTVDPAGASNRAFSLFPEAPTLIQLLTNLDMKQNPGTGRWFSHAFGCQTPFGACIWMHPDGGWLAF